MLLAGYPGGNLLIGPGKEFGGDHHLVPLGEVPQGPAQVLLTGAALVADGGVEEADAQFQPPPDDLPGMCLVDGPAVLTIGGVSKAHAPHTDAGYP